MKTRSLDLNRQSLKQIVQRSTHWVSHEEIEYMASATRIISLMSPH